MTEKSAPVLTVSLLIPLRVSRADFIRRVQAQRLDEDWARADIRWSFRGGPGGPAAVLLIGPIASIARVTADLAEKE
jgi:hypothetical protein